LLGGNVHCELLKGEHTWQSKQEIALCLTGSRVSERVRSPYLASNFQRYEAWDHSNVTQLFDTILQDLPIGAALVLEIGNEVPYICRTLKGAPETGERITENLLDGQQRLTAFGAVFTTTTKIELISCI
jgi:hypothetical protein